MQSQKNQSKLSPAGLIIIAFILFLINPVLAVIFIIKFASSSKKNQSGFLSDYFHSEAMLPNNMNTNNQPVPINAFSEFSVPILSPSSARIRLSKRKKYLHIALNSTLDEAREIISEIPVSDRILIEVGTPLIKIYGTNAISRIKRMMPSGTYIVADNKCADLAQREVEMMAAAGASAATCLGVAPIETIESFIEECQKAEIDSMLDMMNVADSISVLKQLKKLPDVVILHRGVDENEFSKEKQIPYYQIKQIKGSYDVLVAVAGGDSILEVQSAIFNDADIVVVWKSFYTPDGQTAEIAKSFLKEIK